jgi:hypothetical protein
VTLNTRQRNVAVTTPGDGDGACAECPLSDTRQRLTLCQVCMVLTLGKDAPVGPFASSFAERIRWHSAKAPSLSAKGSAASPFVNSFAECARRHSAKVAYFPSAKATTLDKEALPVPRCAFFPECYNLDTRQSTSLSSVTLGKVTRIPLLYLFLLFHTNKQKIYHIIIAYTSQNHHIHQTHDIAHKDHMFLHIHHKVTSTTK